MINISIIGLGLIGGSLALSLKTNATDPVHIKGYDTQESQSQLAVSLGVIDKRSLHLEDAIQDSDFIFICTPVQNVCELLPRILLSNNLNEHVVISDVGSTKKEVMELAKKYASKSNATFIGGHPMAGSHKSGVEAASERLFENAYYVLTPLENTSTIATTKLVQLLKSTRANIVEMKADEHDHIVGAISHFPHVIASSLVEHVYQYHEQNDWYLRLAAGGFRDITRIASSHPRMWRDIVLSNQEPLIEQMESWIEQMQSVLQMIQTGNNDEVEHFFAHAKQVRDGLSEKKKGAIPAFYDLYVDVPDHPGVIGQVTTLLGIHHISITNISILETREDIMGVLRLSFRHEEDVEKAADVLTYANFTVYKRD